MNIDDCNSTEIECENVKVVIRIRPLFAKDVEEKVQTTVTTDEENKVIALTKSIYLNNTVSKSFKFDRIFTEDSTQIELYKYVAFPIVDKTLSGYNGTIFAYGQTGTGKTYTMMGEEDGKECRGIVPNAFGHIFAQISKYGGERFFVVTATYLEIYNEDVRDLLSYNQGAKLEVRERPDVGVYVKGLSGFTIDSVDCLNELMRIGNMNRMTKSTLMNRVSSRSHAIFTITVESRDKSDNNRTTVGKLNLVDLAGSERLQKTHAKGDRLREATNINQSLSVLGSVISALVDGKSTHVPYRNSKLTRLLQDSLGGNSRTAMIATISPVNSDFEESICTLRYASRVKYIKNRLKVNIETKRGLIESFEEEIAKLRHRLVVITLHEKKTSLKISGRKSKSSLEKDKEYEEELRSAETEKEAITQKISTIQKRILVGGENLLEKAQQQLHLLEMSGMELETLNKSHLELEEQILHTEIEKVNVTEKYSSLQEENEKLTEKIEFVQSLLDRSRQEYFNKEQEFQIEIDLLSETQRAFSKELSLADTIIKNFIPKTYRRDMESNVVWNSDIDDFQVRGLQYAGNNTQETSLKQAKVCNKIDLNTKIVYGTYRRKRDSNDDNI